MIQKVEFKKRVEELIAKKITLFIIAITYLLIAIIFGFIYYGFYLSDNGKFLFNSNVQFKQELLLSAKIYELDSVKRKKIERNLFLKEIQKKIFSSTSKFHLDSIFQIISKGYKRIGFPHKINMHIPFKNDSSVYSSLFEFKIEPYNYSRYIVNITIINHDSIEIFKYRKSFRNSNIYSLSNKPRQTINDVMNIIIENSDNVISNLTDEINDLNSDYRLKNIWTYWDFLYFSVITITTTGYGDILPNHSYIRIAVMIEIVCGIIITVFLLNYLILKIKKQ